MGVSSLIVALNAITPSIHTLNEKSFVFVFYIDIMMESQQINVDDNLSYGQLKMN